MPLLLLPLVVLGLLLLWAVLLPVLLLQRYRMGRARQRAIGWVVSTNAWALLVSVVGFIGGAWISGHWVPQALAYATVGLLVGVLLGLVGLWSSRFESGSERYHYTPNRWLILLLTLLVAGRLLLGLWRAWHRLRAGHDAAGVLVDAGSLFAVGGVLLGYYLAYSWGLRQRWRAWRAAQRSG